MSERLDFKGDYMGFTYNGVHSSELGIVRVSDGSRFNENLLPTMQDKTAQVPGGDGTYYFGSYYTQRQFTVNFAFDGLNEQEFERLRNHFGDKKVHDLIFDERPYKAYSAKVTGNATIKYIPFNEGMTGRVYKGEGSLQFTCYNPFARSVFKELSGQNFGNIDEWKEASGILESLNKTEIPLSNPDKSNAFDVSLASSPNQRYRLYNPGIKDSDFKFFYNNDSSDGSNFYNTGSISLVKLDKDAVDKETLEVLQWENLVLCGEDNGVIFDSKLGLIQGIRINDYDNNKKTPWKDYILTGNIYNNQITSGSFFKIPICGKEDGLGFSIKGTGKSMNRWRTNLFYDYYYL